MEVEEQGADGNDVEGDEDGQEDLPDDLNLDDAQDVSRHHSCVLSVLSLSLLTAFGSPGLSLRLFVLCEELCISF